MDFWDLTKMVFRRWYVAMPFIVITCAATLVTANAVKPQYKSVGHVQLIPPTVDPPNTPTNTTARPRNPWSELGQDALGQAVIVGIQQPDTEKRLVAQGLSESFTVAMDDYYPIVNVEAIGNTRAQATETVQFLFALIKDGVAERQRPYDLPDEQKITTFPLDSGEAITVESGNVKRALVAVAGVGLLLTAAITIGVDYLFGWRRRRSRKVVTRPGRPHGPDLASTVASTRATQFTRHGPLFPTGSHPITPAAPIGAEPAPAGHANGNLVTYDAAGHGQPAGASGPDLRLPAYQGFSPDQAFSPDNDGRQPPTEFEDGVDSTIMLPLMSSPPRSGRDGQDR